MQTVNRANREKRNANAKVTLPETLEVRKKRLMSKYKISTVRSRNTADIWARRTESELKEVSKKISKGMKKYAETLNAEERREMTSKARASIDRKKQGEAASAGIKRFWVELKQDPERYKAYMKERGKNAAENQRRYMASLTPEQLKARIDKCRAAREVKRETKAREHMENGEKGENGEN